MSVEKRPNFVLLSDLTTDPEIQKDTKFLDKLQTLFSESETSTLSIPFMSTLRRTNHNFRKSVHRRIENSKKQQQVMTKNTIPDTGGLISEVFLFWSYPQKMCKSIFFLNLGPNFVQNHSPDCFTLG